jgi:WD40 repeat protein
MKYADGQLVAVGDRVKLWDNEYGTVVSSIDTGEFTKEYPKTAWDYLNSGILIKADDGELFHYAEPDEDFELVKSSTAP